MQRYLSVLSSYCSMPAQLEQALRENAKYLVVRKNEILQQVDVFTDNLYFVEKGLFRFYSVKRDGKEVIARFKREDHFILCLTSLFGTEMKVAHGIQALEDSVVSAIPGHVLSDLRQQYPEVEKFLGTILQDDYVALIESGYCRNFSGDGNFECFSRDTPELIGRVPIRYLANFLKLSEPRLRRLVRDHKNVV